MTKLVTHPNKEVRAAAAVGEWQREPADTVRPEIYNEWRAAVLHIHPNHYELQDMFKLTKRLAFEWLRAKLAETGRD